MKQVKTAATALCMMAALWSCKKDTQEIIVAEEPPPVTPTPTAVGFWTGNYGNGASLGLNYAQLLRANGTMRAYIMSDATTDTSKATFKSEGTWSINGLVIKTTYVVNATQTHNTEGIANEAFTGMTGTWKGSTAIAAGGFKLSKKK